MKADYVDRMGDDTRVVNAARVSFDKESQWHTDVETGELGPDDVIEKDTKLVNYLAKHGHFTPFTHPQITMRETVPIFVARQRFKHTVGFSYNEVSRRYVDDTPEFYVPDVWRKRPDASIKQGSSEVEVVKFFNKGLYHSGYVALAYKEYIQSAELLYDAMIESGVAPEQARMVLPQSMFTSYYVTGSLAAWARAYKLRSDPHAQLEIRELATQWNEIISPLFPISWKALVS